MKKDEFLKGLGTLSLLVLGLYVLFYGGKFVVNAVQMKGENPDGSATAKNAGSENDTGPVFPLALEKGAKLHADNPYIADVQEYLNRYYGRPILDVDGAFGIETEACCMEVFGTPAVTKDMYNKIIAPAMGKPLLA